MRIIPQQIIKEIVAQSTFKMPNIQSMKVRAVRVPMNPPHRTASGVVSESPLVLTDVFSDDGVVGHSLVFTYTTAALKPTADLIRNLEDLIRGEPLAPFEIEQKLSKRFRLLGTQGLVGIALAAIDMALWDALARSHDTSLVGLLGGVCEADPGLRLRWDTTGPRICARTAAEWVERGFKGVKAKIGYPTVQQDVAVIRAMREGGRRRRRDHGRLQPVPHPGRGHRAAAYAGR